MKPKIKEIKAGQIVVKSNLPMVDYVINPYTGCQHGCIYCYAEFMKKYTNHKEDWGSFVDAKINAPELIKKGKQRGKAIFISSVCDPYQPIEANYKLTRRILENLVPEQPVIDILTKSALVTRDIDVFKKFRKISIGISLSTLNEELSRKLEPFAASPTARLEALKKCKEAGLETYVFVSPIFPYITEIKQVIEAASFADYIMFENLNIRPTNVKKIYSFLAAARPELVEKYREIYESRTDYWKKLEAEIKKLCKERGKECVMCFHHGGFSKKK